MLFDNKKRIKQPAAPTSSQPAEVKPAAEQAATAEKRGRGRPRKEVSAPVVATQTEAAEKRGRGRPRKTEAVSAPVSAPEAEAPVKRGRGRPPKVANPPVVASTSAETGSAPKRGRGRPRKEVAPATSTEAPQQERRGRGRPRKEDSRTSAPQVTAEEPKRGRGRPRKDEISSTPAPTQGELMTMSVSDSELVPMPTFRPRSEAPIQARQPRPERTERGDRPARDGGRQDSRNRGPKERISVSVPGGDASGGGEPISDHRRDRPQDKRDRPRREDRGDRRTPESPREVAVREKPVPPAPITRDVVRIPNDAPQVIMRDGIPTLVRDGKVFPPMFFFGNAGDEKRLDVVLEQIKYAAEAGVEVVVHYVELEVNRDGEADDAVRFAAFLLKQTLEVAPNVQVLFRLVFTAANGWESKYPKARYVAENGGLGEPSVCDDQFWTDAEHCLDDFVSKMRLLPMAKSVMGVHLERGEWFFAAGWGYDTSAAAQDSFRQWVKVRYRNDNVALCASWFDGQAQFDTLTVPEYGGEAKAGEEFVRTGRKARRWVDYHLFLSDITVERIGKLAHIVKKASDGYFLVGVSYGYTFEWSHPASGHLSLGKLLRTPEVDFIAGPPSYKNREPGGTCPFPGPVDSFALNGKLYISEEDFKTPISGKFEPDDFNPAMKTPQSLETVHWRGLGAANAHGSGICWMDLWGNGWLKSPGIWDRAKSVREALTNRMAAPLADPEIAVFVDERSLAYLVDEQAFALLVQNVRESILRSGLSVGFYLLSDLAHREHFPEAKVYVFLNAWDVRPEVRSAIKTRLQRDNKVLFWMYAAGLFDGGRDALERVREVTGIALKRQPFASKSGTSIVQKKHPLCESLPERLLSPAGQLEPSYFAIPEDGMVLGEYTSTGLPSFVMREFVGDTPDQNWKSVFLGEPVVTPGFFRALGQMAGAHVWNFQEDLVHANGPFVTIHCNGAGQRTIALPDKAVVYSLQRQEWVTTEGSQLRFTATDGQSQSFLIGLKTEVEAILNEPVDNLLHIEEIPDRPENTIRLDDIHFDVPIMKVDAWVEEGWSEEMATDLLFKPSHMEEQVAEVERVAESESTEGNGRGDRSRGRRRRGRRDGAPARTGGHPASDFDISEMNVVFRKRD